MTEHLGLSTTSPTPSPAPVQISWLAVIWGPATKTVVGPWQTTGTPSWGRSE
jgi:hypothetical protein